MQTAEFWHQNKVYTINLKVFKFTNKSEYTKFTSFLTWLLQAKHFNQKIV